MHSLKLFGAIVLSWLGPAVAAPAAVPSCAAWWLRQDDVTPIADLVNEAAPGGPPRFVDRVGRFRVRTEERALVIEGEFPSANIWRFDLTTFDGQFDMRKLYAAEGKCAYPDPRS